MDRIVRRYIGKLLLHMMLSAVLAIISVAVTAVVAAGFSEYVNAIGGFLRMLENLIPLEVLIGMAGVFYFLFYMIIFQIGHYRYVSEMIRAVRYISQGHFETKVPVRERHDLGELAADLNTLILRLKASIEDERRSEQTKNELITNVSHDLRTPLTSILGYLGLVDDDRYRDEVELRHYVQIANVKAKRLHILINDLFDYTRMRHDAMPLRPVQMNMVELVGQLLTQHQLTMENAGMEGKLTASESILTIVGDPDKLVRVFENLLTNAIRYGRDGKRIDVVVQRENEEAVVEIVNYGEPIPSVDLPHIFDRFYRVDKSRADDQGGSGLGLAIAKGIVEKHEGTIKAFSDARQTIFQVRLPLGKKEAALRS